jgi:hypothetical protein
MAKKAPGNWMAFDVVRQHLKSAADQVGRFDRGGQL